MKTETDDLRKLDKEQLITIIHNLRINEEYHRKWKEQYFMLLRKHKK